MVLPTPCKEQLLLILNFNISRKAFYQILEETSKLVRQPLKEIYINSRGTLFESLICLSWQSAPVLTFSSCLNWTWIEPLRHLLMFGCDFWFPAYVWSFFMIPSLSLGLFFIIPFLCLCVFSDSLFSCKPIFWFHAYFWACFLIPYLYLILFYDSLSMFGPFL